MLSFPFMSEHAKLEAIIKHKEKQIKISKGVGNSEHQQWVWIMCFYNIQTKL